jgi:hypothetical protein
MFSIHLFLLRGMLGHNNNFHFSLYFSEPSYTAEKDGVQYKLWEKNYQDPENLKLLSIDDEVKMIPDIYKNSSQFWESLGLTDTTPYLKVL